MSTKTVSEVKKSVDIEYSLRERIIDENENTFPQNIVLETTTFCNLNCVICTHEKLSRKKATMRWPLYIKLVEEIATKGNDSTRLFLCFFGEPLMDKHFADRVFFAKQKGIKNVVINSNLNLMTKELSKELVEAGLNNIFVGLDATTKDVYAQIRHGGDFEKTVNNVLYYKKMLDTFGSDDQQIVVQFIETPLNSHQKNQAVEFWNKHGIKVKVRPMVTWQGVNGFNNDEIELKNRIPCHFVMNVFPITADGKAVYCGCDYDGRSIFADMSDNSIEKVWSVLKKEQRQIQLACEWDKLPEFCRVCTDWKAGYANYE